MLNIFSWSSFIQILVLVLFAYYLFVLVVYFRKDIYSLLGNNKYIKAKSAKEVVPPNSKTDTYATTSISVADKTEDSFTNIHELLEELKGIFTKAANTRMVKEELIQALNGQLKRYPKLEETDLKEDLNQHITLEVKENCGMELFPEDIKRIWHS